MQMMMMMMEKKLLISMARTIVVCFVMITMFNVSSLTENNQDRQTRSGDLDRGPPIEITDNYKSTVSDTNNAIGETYDSSSITEFMNNLQLNADTSLLTLVNGEEGESLKLAQLATKKMGVQNLDIFSNNDANLEKLNKLRKEDLENQSIFQEQIFKYLRQFRHKLPPPAADTNNKQFLMALRRPFDITTDIFIIPSTSTLTAIPVLQTSTENITNNERKDKGNVETFETTMTGGSSVLRNEIWVVPLLALSCATMILILGFEIFVLCKAWRTTPSRRHLFLGQMLLLGLFSCAGLASIFTISPTQFTCAIIRFGTGVSYAIVFASLLVKCVFLISLNGGVYLPAPYQGLLLMFAILIQVAIAIQWLITSPPFVNIVAVEHIMNKSKNQLLVTASDIATTYQKIPLCRTPYTDMILSLIYVVFLISFVTVLAVKSRDIRDNYREATYIGLSVGCSIPTWLIWTVSGTIMNERHRDASIAFGLVVMAIIVFFIMFMPKGRQLAAMGKEGVYMQDREERFSSLSRAGSGYSPSFFHFKPQLKQNGTNNIYKQHNTFMGGDSGLYPAPPSYTRLYQYYPPNRPPGYCSTRYLPGGLYLQPDDGNLYTTLEPTLSSNPNVYFQRGNHLHPGMMY